MLSAPGRGCAAANKPKLVKPPFEVHLAILSTMRSFMASAEVLAAACRALWNLARFSRMWSC